MLAPYIVDLRALKMSINSFYQEVRQPTVESYENLITFVPVPLLSCPLQNVQHARHWFTKYSLSFNIFCCC